MSQIGINAIHVILDLEVKLDWYGKFMMFMSNLLRSKVWDDLLEVLCCEIPKDINKRLRTKAGPSFIFPSKPRFHPSPASLSSSTTLPHPQMFALP